jgi:hypothetical protein
MHKRIIACCVAEQGAAEVYPFGAAPQAAPGSAE